MQLESRKKKYFLDSHHSVAPAAASRWALARMRRSGMSFLSAVTDITAESSCGVPVFKAVSQGGARQLGKGLTPAQARTSAVMEMVERFSATRAVPGAERTQHGPRDALRERSVGLHGLVPCNIQTFLFGDDESLAGAAISWIRATSLSANEPVWVPASRVLLGYRDPGIPDFTCSNGLSANCSREEAVLQGLCELLERHVAHLVQLNGPGDAPRIDLSTVRNGMLAETIDRLESSGYTVIANDHSRLVRAPAVSMLIYNAHAKREFDDAECYVRYGVATSADIALIRCLTEIMQSAAAAEEKQISFPGNGAIPALAAGEVSWRGRQDMVPLSKLPDLACDDMRDEVHDLVAGLRERGIEVLAVDLTHPDLGIPVVRVLCPQLQPNFIPFGKSPYRFFARVSPHLDCHSDVVRSAGLGDFDEQRVFERLS